MQKYLEVCAPPQAQWAQSLGFVPVGRQSMITMQADWPHPSFGGAFLPDECSVDDAGFQHIGPSFSRDPSSSSRRQRSTHAIASPPQCTFSNPMTSISGPTARRAMACFLSDSPIYSWSSSLSTARRSTCLDRCGRNSPFSSVPSPSKSAFSPLCHRVAFRRAFTAFGTRCSTRTKSAPLGGLLALLYAVLFLILRSQDLPCSQARFSFAALAGVMFLSKKAHP